MDCREFEERLFERTEHELPAGVVAELRTHASGCDRCREFEAALSAVAPPADLTAAVLAATAGAACERVRDLICERLDLGSGERDDLRQMHLRSCADCRTIERVLTALALDLPELADLPTDATFLADVIAASTAAPRPRPRPHAAPAAWLGALWMRPRIALEGAYVGTLAIALVFGPSASAFTELPAQVIREVRAQSAVVERVVADQIVEISTAATTRLEPAVTRATEFLAWSGDPGPSGSSWGASMHTALAAVWEHQVRPLLQGLAAAWEQIAAWIRGVQVDKSADNQLESRRGQQA